MGKKIRVYELAQKMGLENKVLLQKLRQAGIEAKSHMSVLGEEDVERIESPEEAPSAPVERIEERRITPGVIRRRRKEVARPERPAPPAAAEEEHPEQVEEVVSVEEEAQPPAPAEVKAEAPETAAVVEEEEAVGEDAVETVAEEAAAAAEVEPVEETAEQVVAEQKVEAEAEEEAPPEKAEDVHDEAQAEPSAEPKEPAKVQKVTANRAKILGRVELSTLTRPAPRGKKSRPERAKAGRPAERGRTKPQPSKPGQMVPGMEPAKEARGGKKGKKAKGGYERDRGFQKEGKGRRKLREVYEPEHETRRGRRGKKAAKAVKKTEVTVAKAIKRIIRISNVITVGELAKRMGVKSRDLITELMRQGTMVTINHPLDYETAALLASEFNYEVENVAFDEEVILEDIGNLGDEAEVDEEKVLRPPVVTIMGHVDHGKTSLLDAIRTTDVTAGEAGGITQHIGAYDVEVDGRKITFLDTPGHEAFTAMRSRGAKVTDIVVLVVAADDGVMPQTREAINHSKAAGVPIIVAVNKIDKPDAKPERVKQELTEYELVPEDWGGETIFVEVSAKNHTNLRELLEMILLQADVLELKANPNKRAKGAIVEARLDRGRGPVATVLVEEGTLRVGDPIVSGLYYGKVRTMTNDHGELLEEAGPSCPVEVTGLSGTPVAGDTFHAVENEKAAKDVAAHRQRKQREQELAMSSKISLEQLYARLQEGEVQELNVIIKADVQGSVEAVRDSLVKLSTDACKLVVIHSAVGGINESDISLASASDAIILGFNVRPEAKAAAQAELEGVDIRLYNVIYDAVNDVRDAMEGLLAPTLREKHLGKVEVRETFHVSKVGTIAGCYVTDGKVVRNALVRLIRDNIVVWEGKLASLKRFKDDVKEVQSGYECGLSLENYNDIKVGDVVEVYEMEEVKTTL
jgi:translation initiation factor IF-2